jgi:hypothetical protein
VIGPPDARLWLFGLVAGVLAGVSAWLCNEAVVGYFSPELYQANVMGTSTLRPSLESIHAAEAKNGTLACAILGVFLGSYLGIAGGLARGSLRSALKAGICGGLAGLGVAIVAAWVGGRVYQHSFDVLAENLVAASLVHGAVWSAIGAVAGLAFGIGLGGQGRIARGLGGGLLGGLLGAVVFDLAGAALFPMDKTYQPVSLSANSRLLAHMAVSVCTVMGAVLAVQSSRRDPSPSRTLSSSQRSADLERE